MILKVHAKDRFIARQASRHSGRVKECIATRSNDAQTITLTVTDNGLVAAKGYYHASLPQQGKLQGVGTSCLQV